MMLVLQYIINYLKMLGIYTDRSDSIIPIFEIFKSLRCILLIIGFTGPMLCSSALYIYYNSSSVEACASGSLGVFAGLVCGGSFFSFSLKMKSVSVLRKELQLIVDEREHSTSFKHYVDAERYSHFFSKAYALFCCISIFFTSWMMGIVNACYNMYIVDNWDPTTYFVPHDLYVPFNLAGTISGYFMQLMFGVIDAYTYAFIMTATISFFVNCTYYLTACCHDFQQLIENIDEEAKSQSSPSQLIDLKRQFTNAVRLHMKTMEYVWPINK